MAPLVKNLPTMQETWVQSLGWEETLEKGMSTHSSIPEEFHGWRSLVGYGLLLLLLLSRFSRVRLCATP